jgi:hypothetical protein
MNKTLFILVAASAVLFLLFVAVYLVFFREQREGVTPQQPESGTVSIAATPFGGEFSNEANIFEPSIPTPLIPSDDGYANLFSQAQETVAFPVLYPNLLPTGYKLTQLFAWDNPETTSGLVASYENEREASFSFSIMTEFSIESLREPNQTFLLSDGELARLWVFEGEGIKNQLLLLKTQEVEERTAYYYVQSLSLSAQELLSIANSAL